MPPVPVQLTARRVDEVVRDGPSGPVRDPVHRVDDVAVEAGEEAKAVFTRKVLAAAGARLRHRKAPGLASGNVEAFVDLDLELALDQLVGGAEPRDTAAEDDDLRVHGSTAARFQSACFVGETAGGAVLRVACLQPPFLRPRLLARLLAARGRLDSVRQVLSVFSSSLCACQLSLWHPLDSVLLVRDVLASCRISLCLAPSAVCVAASSFRPAPPS